jgi:hypothetical protein
VEEGATERLYARRTFRWRCTQAVSALISLRPPARTTRR